MKNKTRKKAASKSRSRDPRRAAADYSECTLESMMVPFDLGYMALSLGRPRKQDPRSAADIYSECALESMIVLFGLGNEALSLGRPCCQVSPNRVEDPRASASHAVRQSEGEQRAKLRELSKQNSELSTKPRPTRKCRFELRRELEKCPIKDDWWEAPVDQLSLEELKLHKRRYEELSKMLIQAIGDRTADSHSNNSDDPPGTASKGISMSLKCNKVV